MTDTAAMPNPVDIFERASRRAHRIIAGIRPEQLDAAQVRQSGRRWESASAAKHRRRCRSATDGGVAF